ncbi:hydroxyethylthiazole kinase [Rhodoplanes serenus]|uniref:Hydroxyethylthiazole kinase n=2 Tax=Rhodoplanes serenus TaxID=200615 RepID=A0A9X4XHW7_9BRAD|nr:hydroxyethylthiazole kinase [Rhodoplanes serenus]MTW15313.1 hydroxyethylthiazole kinase [Rhodoplanes serenus]
MRSRPGDPVDHAVSLDRSTVLDGAAVLGGVADVLARLRERRPRVHCITNTVAQAFTANVLLAAGAVPSMTHSAEEVAAFVGSADALLVNLGTLDGERRAAIDLAVDAAVANARPWVLDPVFVDRSPLRRDVAAGLLVRRPAVVRLNETEFAALAAAPAGPPETAALAAFAAEAGSVVALTGATDRITDGRRLAGVANGHRWMARITAMGCAGAALVAACLAVEDDAWLAAVAGHVVLGVAAERAAVVSSGPGSLAVAILDALSDLDSKDLHERAKVE